jgi:hypothetical protein
MRVAIAGAPVGDGEVVVLEVDEFGAARAFGKVLMNDLGQYAAAALGIEAAGED